MAERKKLLAGKKTRWCADWTRGNTRTFLGCYATQREASRAVSARMASGELGWGSYFPTALNPGSYARARKALAARGIKEPPTTGRKVMTRKTRKTRKKARRRCAHGIVKSGPRKGLCRKTSVRRKRGRW